MSSEAGVRPWTTEREGERALWKKTTAAVAGVLLGIILLVSGGWKILQPFQTGELLEQAQVPAGWGTVGASALGTLEVLAAILLFLPRYRRLGGLLGSALLVFFIAWIAFYYQKLVGHECSCFPIIKRSVGPGFFISDALMLALGVIAFAWSDQVRTLKVPAISLALLIAIAAASYGYGAHERNQVQIPVPIVVDGKPENLAQGKVFLYFYDPMCSHCTAAARFMSKLNWEGTRLIGIPTVSPQFAKDFLEDTHLRAATSLETARLRQSFKFVDPPFGVALVDGQVKQAFGQAQFNEPQPEPELRKLGFIH